MTTRTLLLLALSAFAATALAGQYDDLATWAKRDKASSHQFIADLSKCNSAKEVALALQASATRQHKLTSDLIELIHQHPELRYVPELGLTNEGFRKWADQHPEAAAKRAAIPQALKIAEDVRGYTASLQNDPDSPASVRTLARWRDDPDVIVATNKLQAVLADSEKQLMSTFK
ncbi:MAG TPA: hypothetical protein VGG02_06540 [Chthoniobacterales bacterium]|jgi:hypothetical protein